MRTGKDANLAGQNDGQELNSESRGSKMETAKFRRRLLDVKTCGFTE